MCPGSKSTVQSAQKSIGIGRSDTEADSFIGCPETGSGMRKKLLAAMHAGRLPIAGSETPVCKLYFGALRQTLGCI